MSPDSPINEQESWNKRFEMSLAEIYMELPNGHRAKKDYEALIAEPRGKIVEMSMRLDELEETVRELQLKAPNLCSPHLRQAPQTLIQAVEMYLLWIDSGVAYATQYKLQGYHNDKIREALARAQKIEPLRDAVVKDFRRWIKMSDFHQRHKQGECDWCDDLFAIDDEEGKAQ